MSRVVFVLCQVSHEECYHHGIFERLEDAKAEARRVDDAWNPYPGWDEDAAPGSTTLPLGTPHEWTQDGVLHEATGCGYARWWRIEEELVRGAHVDGGASHVPAYPGPSDACGFCGKLCIKGEKCPKRPA